MSKEITNKQEMPEQLSDILLVLDKEKMKIQAVKSIDENGKMETVDPTKKNQNQFMRVDKSGDFFSNFFSNFFSQLKNPTNLSFFKVSADEALNKAQEMQKQVDNPTPEGEKVMKEHEVKTENPLTRTIIEKTLFPARNTATTPFKGDESNYSFHLSTILFVELSNGFLLNICTLYPFSLFFGQIIKNRNHDNSSKIFYCSSARFRQGRRLYFLANG